MTHPIYYDNLIIEVTRRCNMQCPHCLRGDAQNIDISKEIIDKTLENVKSIAYLTFTGGEPSLNIKAMGYTLSECKRKGIDIYGFFIVTNGLEVTDEFLAFLINLNAYVLRCNGGYDEGINGVALSKDPFHAEIPIENEYKLRSLKFYSDSKDWSKNTYNSLINRGRTETNTVLQAYKIIDKDITEKTDLDIYSDDELRVESETYISANGYVYADCDIPYSYDGKHSIGNLYKDSIYDILINAADENPFEEN